jgi:hypothetical protein
MHVIRLKSKEEFKKCASVYKDASTFGWKIHMWNWFKENTCYIPGEDCLISLNKAIERKFIVISLEKAIELNLY